MPGRSPHRDTVTVTFRLSRADDRILMDMARRMDRTKAFLIRKFIREGIERHHEQLGQPGEEIDDKQVLAFMRELMKTASKWNA